MPAIVSDSVAVYVYRKKSETTELLQLKRTRDDVLGQSWQPIYGGILEGESAEEAAKRELFEETGLRPLRMFLIDHLESFFFRQDSRIHLLPVFAAEADVSFEPLLNEEHDEYRWVLKQEVQKRFLWRSQRKAIEAFFETVEELPETIPYLLI